MGDYVRDYTIYMLFYCGHIYRGGDDFSWIVHYIPSWVDSGLVSLYSQRSDVADSSHIHHFVSLHVILEYTFHDVGASM